MTDALNESTRMNDRPNSLPAFVATSRRPAPPTLRWIICHVCLTAYRPEHTRRSAAMEGPRDAGCRLKIMLMTVDNHCLCHCRSSLRHWPLYEICLSEFCTVDLLNIIYYKQNRSCPTTFYQENRLAKLGLFERHVNADVIMFYRILPNLVIIKCDIFTALYITSYHRKPWNFISHELCLLVTAISSPTASEIRRTPFLTAIL